MKTLEHMLFMNLVRIQATGDKELISFANDLFDIGMAHAKSSTPEIEDQFAETNEKWRKRFAKYVRK